MEHFPLFVFLKNGTSVNALFKPLPFSSSTPFPLNTNIYIKFFFVLYLLVLLVCGGTLKFKIFEFTRKMNFKDNPISIFNLQDQLNGIYLALNIIYTLTTVAVPFPLSTLLGDEVCNFADAIGTLYLCGQVIWSSTIAFYRFLFIKYQVIFSYGLKNITFLMFLSFFCHLFIIIVSVFLAYHDQGMLFKLCTHYSVEELDIMKVRKNNFCCCQFKM